MIEVLLELVEELPTLLHARSTFLFRLLAGCVVHIFVKLRRIGGVRRARPHEL